MADDSDSFRFRAVDEGKDANLFRFSTKKKSDADVPAVVVNSGVKAVVGTVSPPPAAQPMTPPTMAAPQIEPKSPETVSMSTFPVAEASGSFPQIFTSDVASRVSAHAANAAAGPAASTTTTTVVQNTQQQQQNNGPSTVTTVVTSHTLAPQQQQPLPEANKAPVTVTADSTPTFTPSIVSASIGSQVSEWAKDLGVASPDTVFDSTTSDTSSSSPSYSSSSPVDTSSFAASASGSSVTDSFNDFMSKLDAANAPVVQNPESRAALESAKSTHAVATHVDVMMHAANPSTTTAAFDAKTVPDAGQVAAANAEKLLSTSDDVSATAPISTFRSSDLKISEEDALNGLQIHVPSDGDALSVSSSIRSALRPEEVSGSSNSLSDRIAQTKEKQTHLETSQETLHQMLKNYHHLQERIKEVVKDLQHKLKHSQMSKEQLDRMAEDLNTAFIRTQRVNDIQASLRQAHIFSAEIKQMTSDLQSKKESLTALLKNAEKADKEIGSPFKEKIAALKEAHGIITSAIEKRAAAVEESQQTDEEIALPVAALPEAVETVEEAVVPVEATHIVTISSVNSDDADDFDKNDKIAKHALARLDSILKSLSS
eukprot:GILK01000373.1.p1 GENE.GILK01000373.1~~GILK01000373.1.p1  ORF type:complete len:704 (+),score=175.26 GILK01000373.1:317-2113(+)